MLLIRIRRTTPTSLKLHKKWNDRLGCSWRFDAAWLPASRISRMEKVVKRLVISDICGRKIQISITNIRPPTTQTLTLANYLLLLALALKTAWNQDEMRSFENLRLEWSCSGWKIFFDLQLCRKIGFSTCTRRKPKIKKYFCVYFSLWVRIILPIFFFFVCEDSVGTLLVASNAPLIMSNWVFCVFATHCTRPRISFCFIHWTFCSLSRKDLRLRFFGSKRRHGWQWT